MQIVDWFSDGSIVVVDLALACCAVETEFAMPEGAPRLDRVPHGALVVAVVSGTLTDVVAPLVADTIAGLGGQSMGGQSPDGRVHVVSFGACAAAGGPYWDSYSVTKGVDQLVDVDHYIAGCPPPPSALAGHIESLREQLAATPGSNR
ncbi:NADH-quinone oxidoreductase subunit B [Propionibacteriaceae bacterium G1746]|uniref:NADH-quinone oxidoreductase subunit B n=1 Tax=Aestuariimicrobium sp. G57 TaxID=3418485 RepID=UPI003C1FC544